MRWLYVLVAVGFCGLMLYAAVLFWTPAHGGVDQNGYLVGAKQFARTGSMGLTPADPFGFVGRMWIGTPSQTFYPKYPLGLPLLFAVGLWVGGETHGIALAHLVSPVCMALAMLGSFFLIRLVVPSFYAILGTLILATSPVTLWCVNNPNSHASTLAAVVWGMYLLIRWWQAGGLWHARGAGVLLGFAATIRYTEGLLLVPLLMVAVFRCLPGLKGEEAKHEASAERSRPRGLFHVFASSRSTVGAPRLESLVLLFWWALPLFLLVTFNLFWFGDVTGYDSTNESTGFSWDYFSDNWEPMLRQLHTGALFFTLPLGVMGVAFMFGWNTRLTFVLAAWILPSVLLYTAYYWAPDPGGVATGAGYMRFFLTVMPALVMAAMWFLRYVASSFVVSRRAAILTTSALVAFIAAFVVDSFTWETERGWFVRAGLLTLAPAAAGFVVVGLLQHWVVSQETDTSQSTGIVIGALTALLAGAVQLYNAAPALENDYRNRLSLREGGQRIRQAVPAGATLFASAGALHHLQFIGDWRLYELEQFSPASIRRFKDIDPNEPQGLQPQRAMYLYNLLKDQPDARWPAWLNGMIHRSLNWDRPVYVIGNKNTVVEWRRNVDRAKKSKKGEWTERDDAEQLAIGVLRGAPAAKGLQAEIRARWSDAPMQTEATEPGRRPRGAAARRGQRWSPAGEWILIQITPLPPPPPATQPATRPATQPTR